MIYSIAFVERSSPPGNLSDDEECGPNSDETTPLVNENQVRRHSSGRIAQIGIPLVFFAAILTVFTVVSLTMKRHITHLHEQKGVLLDDLQHLHEQKGILSDDLQHLHEQKGILSDDLQHLHEQKGILSDDLQYLRELKWVLSNDLQQLREEKGILSDKLQQLHEQKGVLSDDLQHLHEEKSAVLEDLQHLREKKRAVSDDIQRLRIQRRKERLEWKRERDEERQERERERDKERRERECEREEERLEWEHERDKERREWERERKENEQRRRGHMPFWGEARLLTEECPEDRIRQYDAPMHNLLVEDDWDAACMNTAIDIAGRRLASPRTCMDYGLVGGMRGYWSIEVNSSEC